MNGNNNNQIKDLPTNEVITKFSGLLYWKWWAGVHRLYHGNQNVNNNALTIIRDFVAPLFQFYSIFHLINLLFPFTIYDYHLGHIIVGLLLPIYLSTDLVVGGLFLHLLYNLNKYSLFLLTDFMIWDIFVSICGILAPPFFAWIIGPHHFVTLDYCVLATKPRLSILSWLLNPYFHFMDLIFRLGYSPSLQNDIRTFTMLALKHQNESKSNKSNKNKKKLKSDDANDSNNKDSNNVNNSKDSATHNANNNTFESKKKK